MNEVLQNFFPVMVLIPLIFSGYATTGKSLICALTEGVSPKVKNFLRKI
jgi:hypothetical protein